MARLRLLAVINSLNPGGAEQLLLSQIRLGRENWHARVVCLEGVGGLADTVSRHSIETVPLGLTGFSPGALIGIRREIERYDPDVIHLHLPRAGILGRLACPQKYRKRLVYTEHNVWDIYHPLTRVVNAITFGLNHQVVAVSRAVLSSILAGTRGKPLTVAPRVIHNAVDTRYVRQSAFSAMQAREQLGVPKHRTVVGNVGNLFPRKAQHTLLEAVARLQRDGRDLHVVIIGSGPLHEELTAWARKLDLSGRLTIRTDIQNAAAYMRGFDLFCLSSVFEGLPIALLEAMSLGLPVVATRAGGIPELVDDGKTGLLCNCACSTSLADGLQQVIDHVELRKSLGTSAEFHTEAHFSMRSFVDQHKVLYDSLAN